MKNLSSKRMKVVFVFALTIIAVGATLFVSALMNGKLMFAQDIGGMDERQLKLYAEAVGELPAMAKVESQPSPYGEAHALNFAPVFTNDPDVLTDGLCANDPNNDSNCEYYGPFKPGVWLGDIPAGQTVLIVDIEGTISYCRVLGTSLQGWDVDGWMRCDRLGPVE